MSFKKVTVAGGGVLGSQIAFQSAFKGFDVTIWLRSDASIGRCKPKIERWHSIYVAEFNNLKEHLGEKVRYSAGLIDDFASLTAEKLDELIANADNALNNLKYVTSMEEAFADADLVVEAVAENPDEKIKFYTDMAKCLPEKTVICTNSSTMLPSTFASYTGRADKYLALHFANEIWAHNTAEVMGQSETKKEYYDQVVEFAKEIGMIPLQLKKEQPGYILNSLLVPFLNSGMALLANDVAEPETVDLTWRLATGSPMGPFQILDVVGLTTAYNIIAMNPEAKNPESTYGKIAKTLKTYIDAGKLGITAGEGFYKYK